MVNRIEYNIEVVRPFTERSSSTSYSTEETKNTKLVAYHVTNFVSKIGK